MNKFLCKIGGLSKSVAKWVSKRLSWFNNRKIITKLLSGFFLITFILSSAGYIGISNIKYLLNKSEDMFNKLNTPAIYITRLNESFYRLQSIMIESVSSEKSGVLYVNDIKKEQNNIMNINEGLESTWMDNEKDIAKKYKESINTFLPLVDRFAELLQRGNKDDARWLLYQNNEFNTAFERVEKNIQKLTNSKVENGNTQLKINQQIGSKALVFMIAIILLAVIISIFIGMYISFIISKPIINLTCIAAKLAEGDSTVSPEIFANDEVGALSKAFSNMVKNIREQALTVEKVGNGESDIFIEPKSENDILSMGIQKVVNTFDDLMCEINYLLSESKKQNFNAIGDINKFQGRNKDIIEGINQTLEVVREKIFWYESILDSIPFPICVTDLGLNLTFINKPVEVSLSTTRKEVLGLNCNESNTILNRTGEVIERLKNNETQIYAEFHDSNFQIDSSYLYDLKGNKIGHVEVLQNITSRIKAQNYQRKEVEKLSKNLKLFAEGNLNLNLSVDDCDEYTIEEYNNFVEINNNLEVAIKSISNYINEVKNVLSKMSEGNLRLSIKSDYKGDFVEIKKSLNNIIDSLNSVIGDVNSSAIQVAAGAKMVSEGSTDLSQGASEQASSVEELTAAIAEVASQTKNNAVIANETNELTLKVKENAVQGNVYMEEMLKSMEEINESCQNISKIIKVIDEIAFQTNILALNASVEAARAGQQGRGFAVVAEEVRNLASRSAEAAKETSTLIENSLNIAKKGTLKAQQTYNELSIIVEGVEKASEFVSGIAQSSDEQANAIAQINRGIEQVSKVVQTNSATAEESSATSEQLSSQADRLKHTVGKFILKDEYQFDIDDESRPIQEIDEAEIQEIKSQNEIKIDLDDKDFGKY